MNTRVMLVAGFLVCAAVGGAGWYMMQNAEKPADAPASLGLPVAVVPAEVGLGVGMEASATVPVVAEPAPVTPAAPEDAAPAAELSDVDGLKMGTTLALLTQAYANGGTTARALANAAVLHMQSTGVGGPLLGAVMELRNVTPQEGPTTPLMLVAESQRVEGMGAPKDLPAQVAPVAAPDPKDNWFMRQLRALVTFEKDPNENQNGWMVQMRMAQIQLARGSAGDALLTLTSVPLADDARLDVLRTLVRTHLDQRAKLDNVVHAYMRVYLQAGE